MYTFFYTLSHYMKTPLPVQSQPTIFLGLLLLATQLLNGLSAIKSDVLHKHFLQEIQMSFPEIK